MRVESLVYNQSTEPRSSFAIAQILLNNSCFCRVDVAISCFRFNIFYPDEGRCRTRT
jgi:hypothetical protein